MNSSCLNITQDIFLVLYSRHTSLTVHLESIETTGLLPFKNDGGHCVLGDLQCCRNDLVPFPRSVPRHHPVSELYGQFLQPHGLIFALTCTVNCGTLNRHVLFHILSNQLNLPQAVFNQVVETSQGGSMETGCT